MGGQLHAPAASTPGKDPVPIVQEAGWSSGPVWTGGKSRPNRDSIPDRPGRSQSTSTMYNRKIRLLNLAFLRRVLIVATPAYSLIHVCPSVHLLLSALLPLDGFLPNLVLETF